MNAETRIARRDGSHKCSLQWGRVLMNAETDAEISASRDRGGFNGAAFS